MLDARRRRPFSRQSTPDGDATSGANAVQIRRKHLRGHGLRDLCAELLPSQIVIANRCRCLRRPPLDRHRPSFSRRRSAPAPMSRKAKMPWRESCRCLSSSSKVPTPKERRKVDDDGPRRQTTTTTERMTTKTTTTICDNECAATHCTHRPAQVLFAKVLAPYLNGIRP